VGQKPQSTHAGPHTKEGLAVAILRANGADEIPGAVPRIAGGGEAGAEQPVGGRATDASTQQAGGLAGLAALGIVGSAAFPAFLALADARAALIGVLAEHANVDATKAVALDLLLVLAALLLRRGRTGKPSSQDPNGGKRGQDERAPGQLGGQSLDEGSEHMDVHAGSPARMNVTVG
jgi:hypothetical protein